MKFRLFKKKDTVNITRAEYEFLKNASIRKDVLEHERDVLLRHTEHLNNKLLTSTGYQQAALTGYQQAALQQSVTNQMLSQRAMATHSSQYLTAAAAVADSDKDWIGRLLRGDKLKSKPEDAHWGEGEDTLTV
jgi:hypothetical protein